MSDKSWRWTLGAGYPRASTAATMLAVVALAGGRLAAQDIGLPLGTVPDAVEIQDLDGNAVDLGQWIGKQPVLFEFWATWCPICKALFPRMDAAAARFGDSTAFVVVAVGVNENPQSIKRHLAEHPMSRFTVLWDGRGKATRALGAFTTSYIVVLDGGGKVVYTGSGEDQDIDEAVRKALGH